MGRAPAGSWIRFGCLTVVGLAVIAGLVLGVGAGIAWRQNRDASFEQETFVPETGPPAAPVRLKLDVHTAGVSVKPVAGGEPIRVEADYDPRLYELRQQSETTLGRTVLTVTLEPLGSRLMALLRVKLGGRPAMLRIMLPRDVPLDLEGRMVRSFAAMELGGLSVSNVEIRAREGGVKVAFTEPLAEPMDELDVRVDRGSLSVVRVGNASPRRTRLLQHIGAVDLDLRGAWSRDGEVHLLGGVAGGSLWLPDDVTIRGLDERRGIPLDREAEVPLPVLTLHVTEHMGRFVVMD